MIELGLWYKIHKFHKCSICIISDINYKVTHCLPDALVGCKFTQQPSSLHMQIFSHHWILPILWRFFPPCLSIFSIVGASASWGKVALPVNLSIWIHHAGAWSTSINWADHCICMGIDAILPGHYLCGWVHEDMPCLQWPCCILNSGTCSQQGFPAC